MSTRIEKKIIISHILPFVIYTYWFIHEKLIIINLSTSSLYLVEKKNIFIQWSIGCSYIHLVRNAEKSFVSSQQVNKIFKIETFWHKPVSPLHQNWTEPWLHRVYAGKSQFRCFAPLRGHGRQAHTGTG